MVSKSDKPRQEQREDRQHLLHVGLLVLTVVVVLGLGTWLNQPQLDRGGIGDVESIDTLADDGGLVSLDPREPGEKIETFEQDDTSGLSLAEQSERDLLRIEAHADEFTLQFINACDPAGVSSYARRFAANDRFYLLPSIDNGKFCYRICWGHYASIETARSAGDIPRSLLELADPPYPRRIAEVLP